jgi:hypothetical protein
MNPGWPAMRGWDTTSEDDMNGADRLCDVQVANDVNIFFADP